MHCLGPKGFNHLLLLPLARHIEQKCFGPAHPISACTPLSATSDAFELSCMQVDPRTAPLLSAGKFWHRCSHLLVHSWYSHESFNCYSHEGFNCRPATAGLQSQQMLIFKNYYIFINIYLFGFGLLCYGFWRFGVGPSFSLF